MRLIKDKWVDKINLFANISNEIGLITTDPSDINK